MKPTFRQRLRYYFDNLMSRGTPATVGILFLLTLVVVFIAGEKHNSIKAATVESRGES